MSRPPAPRRDPDLELKFRSAYERAKVFSDSLVGPSLAEQLVELGAEKHHAFDAILASLSPDDRARLEYAWEFWARPKQNPAVLPKHRILAWIAARGIGKSRAAAERVRQRIYAGSRTGALVGPTIEDIERYQIGGAASEASMANGAGGVVESALRIGLLDVFPPHQRPVYKPSDGEIVFHTGAVYFLVTAERPEWRGGNVDTVWVEEATKIPRVKREIIMSNVELSARARAAVPVEIIVTCTPTADPWVKELVSDPGCVTILGETKENAANLAEDFVPRLEQRFGNSRLGRQERGGEILSDTEGALFSAADIAAARLRGAPPAFKRIAVSVDPAISTRKNVDDTGIVGVARGEDDKLYVLAHRAGVWSPTDWAEIALEMYQELGAHVIVVERNRGGDTIKGVIDLVAERRARERGTVAAIKVVEAGARRDGKAVRAEEVQVLSENGRLVFPAAGLVELEDEITTWDPRLGGTSPNGLDALVWGAHYLYDGFGEDPAKVEQERLDAIRQAHAGLAEAQRALPAPPMAQPALRLAVRFEEYDRV